MIERYQTLADYCATEGYQQWLAQWLPPRHVEIDQWYDNESDMWDAPGTPRAQARERRATRLAHHLLDSLAIRDRCVDIGCGDNWAKHLQPQIWGVDPHHERHRDELLTPEWYAANWGRWPHAFTCNAIHFCDQSEIERNLAKVRGILRPGGTAVITINRACIRQFTPVYDGDRLFQRLAQTAGMTRMVWMEEPAEACIDGNVWIWLGQ